MVSENTWNDRNPMEQLERAAAHTPRYPHL